MPFWNKYPFTDFHELNLDWIISKVGQIEKNLKETLEAMAKAITAQEKAEEAQEKAENAQAGAETAEDNAEFAETNTREYYNNLVSHISNDVTGWLNSNVNPVGSAVMVDSSLTISGAAADAQVTGNGIRGLETELSNYIEHNIIDPTDLIQSNADQNITFTNNGDGTISVAGTNTSGAVITKRVTLETHPLNLEQGVLYTIGSNSSVIPSPTTYRLDIRKPDSIGTVYAFEKYENTSFTVPETRTYSIYMRIADGYTFPENFKIRPVLSIGSNLTKVDFDDVKDTIKVTTLNCGNFSRGTSGNPSGTNEMMSQFVDVFRTVDADVYMFTEWDEFFDEEKTVTALSKFSPLKKYHTIDFRKASGDAVAQMQFSDFQLSYENMYYYSDGESRHLTDDVFLIGNKAVHFICTHLPISSETLRDADFNKIISYINDNNIEYAIIGGDFNISLDRSQESNPEYNTVAGRLAIAERDVSIMTNAGFNSVQGGFWGDANYNNFINTLTVSESASIQILPLDNFFFTSNIELISAYVTDTDATDHKALTAEFRLK